MPEPVLITGCSGGLGEALAREFKRKSLRVFALTRALSKIEHLQREGIEILQLDVVSELSIKSAFMEINAKTDGKLDHLVNNSGIGYSMPVLDSNLAIAKQVFHVNVFGLVAVTQVFSRLLIAAKAKVINISSISSKAPMPFMPLYNSTRAAVNNIIDTLRIELEPFDVKVVNVITGTINTPFSETQPPIVFDVKLQEDPMRADSGAYGVAQIS